MNLYPNRAVPSEEQSTSIRSGDRRSYAHIVRSISRVKSTPEQFSGAHATVTSPCNRSDQRGSVASNGNNISNINKTFPPPHDGKTDSSKSNMIHAPRRVMSVKRLDNPVCVSQRQPAWGMRPPENQ